MPGLFLDSDDVCLYVTEKCNSNCIMCPMSLDARKRGDGIAEDQWQNIVDKIPAEAKHLTITGGEPFLDYQHVIPFMEQVNDRFHFEEILVLTNGRILALPEVRERLANVVTNQYCFAIPIHAADPELHDAIAQSPGSFSQAVQGIRSVSETNARIEVRIVAHRLNVEFLNKVFERLSTSGLRIDIINLVAMEMTGCAARNRSELWVNYRDIALAAEKGISVAIRHGINVGLYNFPICSLPEKLWPLAKNSITPYKVRYGEECQSCLMRSACGGMFYSTFELGLNPIYPFQR